MKENWVSRDLCYCLLWNVHYYVFYLFCLCSWKSSGAFYFNTNFREKLLCENLSVATLLLLCENNMGFLMAPVETDTDQKKKKLSTYCALQIKEF